MTPRIEVVRGEITRIPVEAVVTAANQRLVGGSGVNGAVHAAAGPELLRALHPLAPCPPGGAVVTPAVNMTSARWVVHAVGPRYHGPQEEPVLASAYTSALTRADEVGAASIAFPTISTGVYGYPDEDAARISVCAVRSASTRIRTVVLVAFTGRTAHGCGGASSTRDPATLGRRSQPEVTDEPCCPFGVRAGRCLGRSTREALAGRRSSRDSRCP